MEKLPKNTNFQSNEENFLPFDLKNQRTSMQAAPDFNLGKKQTYISRPERSLKIPPINEWQDQRNRRERLNQKLLDEMREARRRADAERNRKRFKPIVGRAALLAAAVATGAFAGLHKKTSPKPNSYTIKNLDHDSPIDPVDSDLFEEVEDPFKDYKSGKYSPDYQSEYYGPSESANYQNSESVIGEQSDMFNIPSEYLTSQPFPTEINPSYVGDQDLGLEAAEIDPFEHLIAEKIVTPAGSGEFKSWMPYQTITSKTSNQYKLQNNPQTYTNQDGIRCYNYNDYEIPMIAVGTGVTSEVGKIIQVVFKRENGDLEAMHFVTGDIKADKDTDEATHTTHNNDRSVIEFLIDKETLKNNQPLAKDMGDLSYLKSENYDFSGSIESLTVFEGKVEF